MLKVDSVLAADANLESRQQIAIYSESAKNKNTNPGMSFGDYLNSQLKEKIESAHSQIAQYNAASILAWYYPPKMITPKNENKLKTN